MNGRESHAFVFGGEALTNLRSGTRFGDGETILTDPFTQTDEGESLVRGIAARHAQSREQAQHGSGPSSKGTVVTVRKNVAVVGSKRSSRHGSRAGTEGKRRDSAGPASGRHPVGMEAFCSVG